MKLSKKRFKLNSKLLRLIVIFFVFQTPSKQAECDNKDSRCKECKEDKKSCSSCKISTDWIFKNNCLECSNNYMCETCDQNLGCKKCYKGFEIYKYEETNFCKQKPQNCNPGNERCQYCEEKNFCSICKDPTDFIDDKGFCHLCSEIKNCLDCDKKQCTKCKEKFTLKDGKCFSPEELKTDFFSFYFILLYIFLGIGILVLFLLYWFRWRLKWKRSRLGKQSRVYNEALVVEEDVIEDFSSGGGNAEKEDDDHDGML